MSDKLNIANEMAQFDYKNREFYNSLTDEEKKKFSNYLMIRWGSSVTGIKELQEYYLIATNERFNKHFFDIKAKHAELQWLLATTVSPGMGKQRHQWVSFKKESNALKKKLAELCPHAKDDELELLSKLVDSKHINEYLTQAGQDTKK